MTRYFSLSLLLLSSAAIQGFAPANLHPAIHAPATSSFLSASVEDTSVDGITLVVEGKNIEVTDALSEYVDKRIGNTLEKLSGDGSVRECDVILSVSKNPKVRRMMRIAG